MNSLGKCLFEMRAMNPRHILAELAKQIIELEVGCTFSVQTLNGTAKLEYEFDGEKFTRLKSEGEKG